MELYVYESHLGGVYFDKEYKKRYLKTCNQCGDSDRFIGKFESVDKLIESLKDEDGFFMYDEDYIREDWHEKEE